MSRFLRLTKLVIALALAVGVISTPIAHAREWKSADGTVLGNGEFYYLKDGKVVLFTTKEAPPIALDRLCQADRKYVEERTGGPITAGRIKSELVLKGADPDDSSLVVRMLFGFADYTSELAISPDGHYLASGGLLHNLTVSDLALARRPAAYTYSKSTGSPTCLRITPDGKRLVVGDSLGKVSLFRFEQEGRPEYIGEITCGGPKMRITSIAISPDNVTILVGIAGAPLVLCRLDSCTVVETLARPEQYVKHDVTGCAFSSNGVAAVAFSNEVLYSIDPAAKTIQSIPHDVKVSGISRPSISPDASKVLAATGNGAVLLDVKTANRIRTFGSRAADAAAFVADGSKVLVVSEGNIEIYTTAGQQVAADTDEGFARSLSRLVVSDDGRYFAMVGSGSPVRVFRVPGT